MLKGFRTMSFETSSANFILLLQLKYLNINLISCL
jgi:hypothetical protein